MSKDSVSYYELYVQVKHIRDLSFSNNIKQECESLELDLLNKIVTPEDKDIYKYDELEILVKALYDRALSKFISAIEIYKVIAHSYINAINYIEVTFRGMTDLTSIKEDFTSARDWVNKTLIYLNDISDTTSYDLETCYTKYTELYEFVSNLNLEHIGLQLSLMKTVY